MPAPKKDDMETQQRAVRMYLDRLVEDDGATPAANASEPAEAEVVRLRAEVARLRRANEILKTASASFAAAELDRRLGQ